MKARVLVLLILAFLAVAVLAQDTDPFVSLENGQPHSSEIEIDSEYHGLLFSFGATEGDVITISTQSPGEQDTYLVLYGPEGLLEVFNDDASDGSLNAAIEEYEIRTSGNYYALVSTPYAFVGLLDSEQDVEDWPPQDIYMAPFEIEVQGNRDPDVDHEFVEAEIGDSLEIEITEESPVGYVSFEAQAGNVVNITATSDDVDTIVYLFRPGGPQVGFNDDIDRRDENYNSAIEGFEIPMDGTYLIFVTVYDYVEILADQMDATGTIALTIE